VRSGDFVIEMLRQSRNANECAFALGALAHYTSDVTGHPAVNRSVALLYPKLRAKFGDTVRYAEHHKSHLQTEYGFDLAQVAKRRYTSPQYHDFIGFEVSKDLLERVFPVVYGVPLDDLLPHADLTVGSYRFAISQVIPVVTKAALQNRKKDLQQDENSSIAQQQFLFRISRAEYESAWGKGYQRPGFPARILAVALRVIPRFGPFKILSFRDPTPETQELYFQSINLTVDRYRAFLRSERTKSLKLANVDFDTGAATHAAEYPLTDEAYAKLLLRLQKRKFDRITPALRADVLSFYANLSLPIATKNNKKEWREVLSALEELKAAKL
jgi:hypothetical protein